jgi:hypothetical protein
VFARPLLVLAAAVIASLAGPAPPAPPPPEAKRFSHQEHVSDAWLSRGGKFLPEVWRDCRGCHRFDAANLVSAPQRECDGCHTGPGLLTRQFDVGWQDDLSGHRTRTRDGFRHHTHAMLECRECHAPFYDAAGQADFGVLFAHFEIQTGPGQCARCHDGNADSEQFRFFAAALDPAAAAALGMPLFTKPSDPAAYARRLLAVFGGPDGGMNTPGLPVGGDFDHGDHLHLGCVDCHTNIERATATEVGTGAIPVGKCGDCHVTGTGRTAARPAAGAQPVARPLHALGTFAHADHYRFRTGGRRQGVCTDAAYGAIESGCATCHTYRPEAPGRGGRDFPFAAGTAKHRYTDCQQCHEVPGWSTGESAAAPLHASTGGGGAGWAPCAACHVLGEPALATRRPQVTVQRFTRRTFVFPANAHPDITQVGVQRGQQQGRPPIDDCTACHRAAVPQLATRLAQQVFRHASHLPASPQAADCIACHPSAAVAADAPALAPDLRTYTLAGCSACHWGGAITEAVIEGAAAVRREVTAFPHGPHVGKAGLSCLVCHEAAADGRGVATRPAAAACNACHDHRRDPDQPGDPTCEGLFDGAVDSCVRCHHEPAGAGATPMLAVPAPRDSERAAQDPRYRVPQSLFAGFADPQFHPSDGSCSDCHRANLDAERRLRPIRVATVEQGHLATTRAASVHAPDQAKGPAECLRCHWKPVGPWETAVRGAAGDGAAKEWRRAPQSAATRQRLGNEAVGYPGTERAQG